AGGAGRLYRHVVCQRIAADLGGYTASQWCGRTTRICLRAVYLAGGAGAFCCETALALLQDAPHAAGRILTFTRLRVLLAWAAQHTTQQAGYRAKQTAFALAA